MSKLLPYETIVKAHEGDPDAIDTASFPLCRIYPLLFQSTRESNAEIEEYVKQKLIAARCSSFALTDKP